MSKKETKNTEQNQEKVMTKYDLKMERRREQKRKELRDKRLSMIGGIALVVVLAGFVASFPIRNYLTINGSYIRVNGEDISRVEYDYYYSLAKSSYLTENGAFLSYFGYDLTQDFDGAMYSETLTWGDFFDELTVDNISRNKALLTEAQESGFTYDITADYEDYLETLEEAAVEAGMTRKAFIQDMYGVYATEARVRPYIEEGMYTAAYYDTILEQKTPTQEEIREYYENNTANYDSVDYYIYSVDAELPTEPTELADPVEETESAGDADAEEGTEDGAADESAEEVYEPSEAEIAAAMEEAKAKAEDIEKDIRTEGELTENVKKSSATYILQEWLFDEARVAGDTTIIEDTANNRYYVLEFVQRYLDQTRSADVRVVMTANGDAQAILDEWKSGAATEESFAEICDKYSDPVVSTVEGGLYEGLMSSSLTQELRDWIFDSARVAGDTAVITPEGDAYGYVLYYVAPNREEWILSIEGTILNERMVAYMDEIVETVEIEDPKNNLYYLEVRAAEEAAAAESAAAESEAAAGSEAEGDGAGE